MLGLYPAIWPRRFSLGLEGPGFGLEGHAFNLRDQALALRIQALLTSLATPTIH